MPIKQVATVSVDIGHSYLKMVQTSSSGQISKFVVHKMPDGCVDDLTISSEETLIASLKKAKKESKMPGGKCFLVLSGSDIIARHFTLPKLSEEDLYQNVLHEMSGYLPVDPEKYYVDYKIAGTVVEEGIEMYKVLVTTASKRVINGYRKALKSAGFNAKIIDTGENASEKLLRYNKQISNDFPIEGGICILDFGTKYTRANLYNNGYYYVSNVLKRSSQSITEIIAKISGKDILTAENIKRKNDFLCGTHENEELSKAIKYEIDSLLFEVSRVFDYFRNRTKNTINTIYISGGGSLLLGLGEYLEKHIGIPVHYASELIGKGTVKKNVDTTGFGILLNAYAATYREEI